MNALERLLQDELNRLADAVAAATREGTAAGCASQHPDLHSRIEKADARLTTTREELLKGYGAWREALDDYANLWAVAELEREEGASSARPRRRAA